jgi:hypothetical protein
MTAIKSRIFKIWDTAPLSVRICCIKFTQRVILVQTLGPEKDARVCTFRYYRHNARLTTSFSVDLWTSLYEWYQRTTPFSHRGL